MPLTRIQTDAIKDAITTTNILDGTILPADLSTGRPYWDSSSNVGIGAGSSSVRLYVASSETGYASTAAEGISKATLLLKTHSTDSTLTAFGGVSGGHAYIQRTNGPGTTPYSLILNPFGGGVGIGTGTATPSSMLNVKASGANGIVLETDGADSTASTRLFGKNATSTGCIFHYDNSGNPIWCITSGSTVGASTGATRLTVSQYGLALGNYDAATSGTGIKFPVAQNASSDPNTLDDYEEGTWTPQAGSESGAFTQTGTFVGKYVKIGNRVWASFDCTLVSRTLTGSIAFLHGLPFPVANNGDLSGGAGSVSITFNHGTNFYQLGMYPQNNSSYCYFTATTSNTSGLTTVSNALWAANTRICGGVWYNTTA